MSDAAAKSPRAPKRTLSSRAHRSTRKRAVPPHPESDYSLSHDLITPADVERIGDKVGLPKLAQDRLAHCAWLLNDQFLWAICAADRDAKTAPRAVLREHFADGASKTWDLVHWIGFEAPGDDGPNELREPADLLRRGLPQPIADNLKNLWLAVGEPDPRTVRWEPAEIAATAPMAEVARQTSSREMAQLAEAGKMPAPHEIKYMRGREDIERLWAVIPHALALLFSLSRRAQEVEHKRGKPNFERTFVKEIYWRLAYVYKETFGRAVTADTRRKNGIGPATLWVKEVFRTAACRVAERIQPRPPREQRHRHPVVWAFQAVSRHAHATLSSNLEGGHRALKRRAASVAPESG